MWTLPSWIKPVPFHKSLKKSLVPFGHVRKHQREMENKSSSDNESAGASIWGFFPLDLEVETFYL